MKLPKWQRLAIFFERLNEAVAVGTSSDAYDLLCDTLNQVEDEFSNVPPNPSAWKDDGRIYPPMEDNRIEFPFGLNLENNVFAKYRSRMHYTYIGTNGSILIETRNGILVFSKPGRDGRSVLL